MDMTSGLKEYLKMISAAGGRIFLAAFFMALAVSVSLSGCGREEEDGDTGTTDGESDYTLETEVVDVMNDPVFGDYGRLIFPVDKSISDDLELQDVGDILTWYNNVDPERTVEIANYLRDQAASGDQIFYDIYTDEEKAEDPDKENAGLFFFRGEPGAKTWQEQSPFSMSTGRSCLSTWRTTPCGAARQAPGWRHGSGPMARRPSGKTSTRHRRLWSCSTPDCPM